MGAPSCIARGRDPKVADGSKEAEEAFAAGAKGVPLLGALPGLDYEVETLMALLEEEGLGVSGGVSSLPSGGNQINRDVQDYATKPWMPRSVDSTPGDSFIYSPKHGSRGTDSTGGQSLPSVARHESRNIKHVRSNT